MESNILVHLFSENREKITDAILKWTQVLKDTILKWTQVLKVVFVLSALGATNIYDAHP